MAQAAEKTRRSSKPSESFNGSGEGAAAGVQTPNISREVLLKAYGDMLLIRRFEEKAGQLYGMGLIGGFCHLYIGQEAVVVGVQSTLKQGDEVITSYRDHGHMLATGMEPRGVMAELTGRSGGYSKGKGGSMHMFSKEKNFFGGHGIVGAQVSLGTGLAFSNWYRENDSVCVTYFGDGAANQGQVFESFNLAALMKLPCIYVIENNKYGMGTSIERATASRDLSRNGSPWNMASAQVDGMDVVTVREAALEAVEHCRAGKGPFLLEMQTYRYRGHALSEHDCIDHARQMLLRMGESEDALKQVDAAVKARINEAAEFAQSSPEPDEQELWTNVLVET